MARLDNLVKKNYRILVGTMLYPSDVNADRYYAHLKSGFDKIGVNSVYTSLDSSQDESCPHDQLMGLLRLFSRKCYEAKGNSFKLFFFYPVLQLLKTFVFCRLLFQFNVFIFSMRSAPFFGAYGLYLLQLFQKCIIVVCHGSDARPPYLTGKIIMQPNANLHQIAIRAKRQKQNLKNIEKYADWIICHPTTGIFLEKRFVSWLKIGIPFDPPNIEPKFSASNEKVRILHAPTSRLSKGTQEVSKIIEKLCARGFQIEFNVMKGHHKKILDEIARCDFVIDQIYSSSVMPTLITEAAFLGKPSVISGYATLDDMGLLEGEEVPPSLYCRPSELESAIEKMIRDKNFRLELGKKANQFVKKNWSCEKVAERFLALIDGNFPKNWLYAPERIKYINGCGVPEAFLKNFLHEFIEKEGWEALQLPDKPQLEQKLAMFAAMRPA